MTNADTRLNALTRMMDEGQKLRLIEAARMILMDGGSKNENKGEDTHGTVYQPREEDQPHLYLFR